MKVPPSTYNAAIAATNTVNATGKVTTPMTEALVVKPNSAIDPALGEAQSQLATLPDVDTKRVAEMKDAIKARKINIDLDELTSAIQQYFQR